MRRRSNIIGSALIAGVGVARLTRTPGASTRGFLVGRDRGFLLIEAMLASVILAVAAVAIAGMLAATYQQTQAMRNMAVAAELAQQLVEEIAAKPLCEADGSCLPGPEPGENQRDQFNNADDYDGFTDSTAAMQLQSGGAISAGDGAVFLRSVSVQYMTTPNGPNASAGDFALLTVRVTTPEGQTISVTQLLTRYSWAL